MADFKIQLKDRQGNNLFPRIKLSNAINDADFITASEVSENYVTNDALAELLAAKLSREVVEALPTGANIKTNVIYMVPNEESDSTNVYNEYIYTNNKWEFIGTTATKLDGYATEAYVDSAISDALSDALSDMATKTWVGEQNYATETYVSANYAPINNAALTGLPTTPNVASDSASGRIANKKFVEDHVAYMFLQQNLVYSVIEESDSL